MVVRLFDKIQDEGAPAPCDRPGAWPTPQGGVDVAKAMCSVEDCEREVIARGWCVGHYDRWRRYGQPLGAPAVRERFWSKVDKTETCWLWTAAKDTGGYGRFGVSGKVAFAHRHSYEFLVGPIPEGLELDHLCRVPACVNPSHLEPVTHAENLRRAITNADHRRNQTSCIHGHPFDEANTIRRKNGGRGCRECGNAGQRKYQARLREMRKVS